MKTSNSWQLVWDNNIVDVEKTDAALVVHKPEPIETAFVFDAPWELYTSSYHHIVKCHDGKYRLYYIALPGSSYKKSYVCAIESEDLVNWYRPVYNLYNYNGSTENNILYDDLREGAELVDNFIVFLDSNPQCKISERYKAIGLAPCVNGDWSVCDMWYYASEDGIHWKFIRKLFSKPAEMVWCFDSDNRVIWDGEKYVMFFRGRHLGRKYVQGNGSADGKSLREIEQDIYNYRDIQVAFSKDFITWDFKGELKYADGEDYQIYANQIMKYPRNENLYIGFFTRNAERRSMEGSFSQIGGPVRVCKRCEDYNKLSVRTACVLTDAVFAVSNDGENWHRSKDAFYTAGPETSSNWSYGDGYVVPYLFETKGRFNRIDKEYSLYFVENSRATKPKELFRYAIRLDGFESLHADYYGAKIVTKPLIFYGSKMFVNVSTSAVGGVYVSIMDDEGNKIESLEVFGDSSNREVVFKGNLQKFSGKKVIITFTMRESDIYSFIFKD